MKDTAAASASQIPENPQVLIRYSPSDVPVLVAKDAIKTIASIQSVKAITTPKQLETASVVIAEAQLTIVNVEGFVAALRERIQEACERIRELDGYGDFEATLTIRKWNLRARLMAGLDNLRTMRARFISDEKERVRREQQQEQARQDKINREAAEKAAAAARKLGASAETAKEIAQAVKETPAPIVTSKALDQAEEAGYSIRYNYTAEITSLKSFLGACLSNDSLFNTLSKAIPDIEKAFGGMARDQKELFKYPGLGVRKTPVDVKARRA